MQDNNAPSVNPFAPPQAEVADVATQGPALASRSRRLVAVVIDSLIQGLAFWLLSRVWPGALFDSRGDANSVLVNGAVGVLLFLLIQGLPLVRNGQTLGKMLLGMRIVRSDGSRVGAARVLGLRYGLNWLLMVIPIVGALWALMDSLSIFRQSRRCLHDQLADTIVVNA